MRRSGFSLLEVIFAIAVLAVGILSVFGSMAYASRDQGGGRAAAAAQAGHRLLDLSRARNLPFAAPLNEVEPVPLNAPPFDKAFPADSGFQRQVTMQPAQDGRTATMRVVMRWQETGEEKRLSLETLHRRP